MRGYGRTWLDLSMAGYGCIWLDMARCNQTCLDTSGYNRIWPYLVGHGTAREIWPDTTGTTGMWPDMAGYCRIWPDMADMTRYMAACGRTRPDITGYDHGRVWSDMAGYGQIFFDIAGRSQM